MPHAGSGKPPDIHEDQPIAEIDDSWYKAALEQAEGQMRSQPQELDRMRA